MTLFANDTLTLLRRFDGMAQLDWPDLASVARHVREIVVPAQRTLVRPPRQLRGVWYLCAGTLRDERSGKVLRAGSKHALDPIYPGHTWLRTLTRTRLLQLNERAVLLLKESGAMPSGVSWQRAQVQHDSSETPWLDSLAASPLLQLRYARHGAAGWQRWLRELESIEVGPGEAVVRDGEYGTSFFVVQQGAAQVAPAASSSSSSSSSSFSPFSAERQSTIVSLGAGGFFGEDAVLSGQPRNACVHMPEGGRLLRGNANQLAALVDDLWWALARREGSWRRDNELLCVAESMPTARLREYLDGLPRDGRYGVSVHGDGAVKDLLLFLLVHRGYAVGLCDSEEPSVSRMHTLNGSAV